MSSRFAKAEVTALLEEAYEARALAAELNDEASVQDLLHYAAVLEEEAARLGVPDSTSKASATRAVDQQHVMEPSREAPEPNRTPHPVRRAG